MPKQKVTIVLTQRERFSSSIDTLASCFENCADYELIYIDTNSPSSMAEQLEQAAQEHNFKLVRTNKYLTQNAARNIGASLATGEFVIFIDNDVAFLPHCIEHLVACAEETGASIVGPLYIEGEFEKGIVHMAGGIGHIAQSAKGRHYVQQHRFPHKPLAQIPERLHRQPTELVEFHCLLARKTFLESIGPLDEQLMHMEHNDLCLLAQERNCSIYFEPEAVVNYYYTRTLSWSDLLYFFRRYSDLWTDLSVKRFAQKWDLSPDDQFFLDLRSWVSEFRSRVAIPETRLENMLGRKSYVVDRIVRSAWRQTANLVFR